MSPDPQPVWPSPRGPLIRLPQACCRDRSRLPKGVELHGSLADNLKAAVRSAERLRGHPIHADTMNFWLELLSQARASIRFKAQAGEMEQLTGRLQMLLSERAPV